MRSERPVIVADLNLVGADGKDFAVELRCEDLSGVDRGVAFHSGRNQRNFRGDEDGIKKVGLDKNDV